MDATIEEFGKLYPAYATLYFKDECEIVETAPKSGKVAIEDVAYLDAGMSKISHMESYEDYGSPFCVMDWERYKR